ncbi:MAG: alpha/beta fold hydrolase [Nitrospirota bacterium]|nr:alpha/beta fold hydrolase [Nitrospirota bacterium]
MATGAILIALTITSCASRPGPGVLTPIEYNAPGAKLVTVYVATTRQPAASGENVFTSGRSPTLNFVKYTISIPANHKPLQIEWPQDGAVDPATNFVTVSHAALTETGFKLAVQSTPVAPRAKREVVIFVHGYNYSFQESVYRMAQLIADGGIDVSPILFAWPSEGSISGYGADKEAVTYSRDSLARVLTMVAEMPNIGEVELIGHSMGAWLTTETLRQLRLTGKDRVIGRLHQVALVSPDIDVNVFRSQMAVIGRLDPPMKVLVSKDDQALSISARLAGSAGRVGNLDIADPAVEALAATQNIQIIDISNIPATGYMKHDRCFIGVSTMLNEIARSGHDTGVGNPAERAGAFVLDSAGMIVASPFKLVRGALPN